MQAVRLTEFGKPLELQEIPIPNIGDKDILVRVRAAGVSATRMHITVPGVQAWA